MHTPHVFRQGQLYRLEAGREEGDNNYIDVKGLGSVVLHLTGEDGSDVKITLSKCFYLPKLSRNLLSVRCLREKGVKSDLSTYIDRAVIHKGCMRVKSEENLINKLYMFKTKRINTPTESAYIGVSSKPISLWHMRCGHLGYQNIARLVSRGKAHGLQVPKLDLTDFPVCDVCQRSNQQRASFKDTHTRHATRVNELIYTDVKGAIEVPSFGGKLYVLVFVDDFSGFVTTYLLENKSEALDRFKEYVIAAETKHNRPVQSVNSDNGGEFISSEWIRYCNDKGIYRRPTSPYTPEQNGSAEVRFKVLFRKVRALLIGAQLPKQFWGEALLTATVLNNISPLRRANVTPYERWHGKEPDYSNLRVFGSLAYTYVTETHSKRLQMTAIPGKRKTLDNRSIRGIFVGRYEGVARTSLRYQQDSYYLSCNVR
ncbi:LOW QUALITY PROTEIN: Integrase, catalytic core protein [Phytophthora megakarya]|uniref:Integrase, catalytic core protein n=1 Tax=Phytophthora megakarya TaxID=4795 RepID=A0A225WE81_9STRA|nr:LOW QUALITY PROTEIN: Integrase, catalytic core protein [Phytophthora megakarya]